MATARRLLVSANITRYYHCTSRCVRGAYLCGNDSTSNKDFTHRREWLQERLLLVADVFSLQLAAYSIMENHFHVIVRLDPDGAATMSDQEVVRRWHQLFKGNSISQRFASGEILSDQELPTLRRFITLWRNQLNDLGWFMRCVKEPLARMANQEDGCKGRFWEGRFHSQALLDDRAVAACMVYVDLNPLRAGMCKHPEDDAFTSLSARINRDNAEELENNRSHVLISFADTVSPTQDALPFSHAEYLSLLDSAARIDKPGKRGTLDANTSHIMLRLGLVPKHWRIVATEYEQHCHRRVGSAACMTNAASALGIRSAWGSNASRRFFLEDSPT